MDVEWKDFKGYFAIFNLSALWPLFLARGQASQWIEAILDEWRMRFIGGFKWGF